MNDITECKSRLPLPALLVKLGFAAPDRNGFTPSPFRPGESGDSFHVFERGGQHFFKDHASGERGGDEVDFLERLKGISTAQAIELYHELAGVQRGKSRGATAKPRGQSSGLGTPVATYTYKRADGTTAFEVLRYLKDGGGKTFRQRRRAKPGEQASNGWIWRVEEKDRVLYRLPEVLACPPTVPVFLVEGEKDADNLAALGLVATCNAAGAGKWQSNYTASLAGKWVAIIGDNDEPGRAHVRQVSELLRPIVARLGIIDLANHWPECPEKGDVSDWLAAGKSSSPPASDPKATLISWTTDAPDCLPKVATEEVGKSEKPWIQLPGVNRQLSQFAEQLGEALRDQAIYKRSGVAMWPNYSGSGLDEVSPKAFASWIERFVTTWSFVGNPRSRAPVSMSNEDAGRVLASKAFLEKLRPVGRINPVRLPVLRQSNALELLPVGYDAESETLTLASIDYPVDIPFADAWETIVGLIQEFPFAKEPVDDAGEILSFDRNMAVAISAMISVYAFGLLPAESLAPAFVYVANTEGAGKTLLASLALVPVHGAANTRPQPKDEEKLKQELLSIAMSAKSYVVFDNWRGMVASSSLEAFLTATRWEGRILGRSNDFETLKEVMVFITGNNCTLNGDMRRRSLLCELFVEEARSEDRKIAKRMDIPAIQARRAEILGALWAIVKHWDAQGRPVCSREHGSFAAWARTIGGIVECARFGCCIGESRSTRSGDLYLQQMTQLCEAVFAGRGGITVADERSSTPAAPGVATPGAAPARRGLKFDELVGVAQEAGLFEELLEVDGDGNLDRKARSAFSRMLKRYDARVFKGTIRMQAHGAGHGRHYLFERLGGG